MLLPIDMAKPKTENALMQSLENARAVFEANSRLPQPPAVHARTERMLMAISSAIAIVKRTHMSELTQQGLSQETNCH